MKADLTKSQRRRIRDLAGTAYDRELSRELTALEEHFGRWRRGEIDAHELSDQVHRFHQGPNRRLFLLYAGSDLDTAVASAIARGILSEDEASPEIVDLLGVSIKYARENPRRATSGEESDGDPAVGGRSEPRR
ncbi:MAG TPA: hypothetical protein VNO55_07760 [Polyangia bacterium]|nr:hypothetical protein [Polyangia bacterium]